MYLRKKWIAIALVAVLLIGCTPVESNPVNGKEERFDLGKIESLRESLPQIEYVDLSLGYDQEGSLTAWAAVTEDIGASSKYGGNADHLLPIFRRVLDNTPEATRAWLFTHVNDASDRGAFAYMTRDTYTRDGLSDISDADSFRVLASVRWYDTQYYPRDWIEELCREFFGSRLLGFRPEQTSIPFPTFGPCVEGMPDDYSREIAKVYCLLHSLAFPATYVGFGVTYMEGGKSIQTTRSEIGYEAGQPITYKRVWYDVELFSGGPFPLKFRFSIEVLNEDYKLPEENTIRIPYDYTLKRPDLTYEEMMEELQHYEGISVEHLGYGQDGLTAVLTMKDQDNAELHRRQWEIALTTMETPVNTLWFITESEERIVVSCFDRQRYDILQFIGDEITVSHEDWPMLAKYYWEKAK